MKNKLENLRQLPSGNWQLRFQNDGLKHSHTFDHKPTQKEIADFIFETRKKPTASVKGTFEEGANAYIDSKRDILSPSTINSYESILRNLSESFCATILDHIDTYTIQREINTYSKNRSAKTVKNASGFISSVVLMFIPDMNIRTTLPQKDKIETYIPTDAEMKLLLNAIKGSPYEAVLLLTIYGLRKSEAIAVTSDDIKGNLLTISHALVVNSNGEYVEKKTKTTAGTRTIWIPTELATMIKSKGKAYYGFPGNILRYLHRTQDALGINRCKLHALRHWYVSMSHAIGTPDSALAATVGHSSSITTRNVYLHAQRDKQEMYERNASDVIMKLREE